MKCDAYRILISEMEQNGLNADEAELVRGHLDTCENCRAFQAGLRTGAGGLSASHPTERSWGWAVLLLIGSVTLVALVLVMGHGRWSYHGMSSYCGRTIKHTGWRVP